jgi:dTDP-4-amino-4,6-dideoxygalactose transaminase
VKRPAVLGGPPAFPGSQRLPIARPEPPPLDQVMERLRPSYSKGMMTNGELVDEFEALAAARLGAAHAVAVSCCTTGLTA